MRPGRVALINLLGLLVVLIAGAIIFYLWHQGYYFYNTDDALVSGDIISVAPPAPGVVAAVDAAQGQTVHAGQAIFSLRAVPGATVPGASPGATTAGGSAAAAAGSAVGALVATSPIAGTLIAVVAQPGQVVQAGQSLAQVVDLSKVYITAYVDEKQISDIHPGQGVDVTVDAVSDVAFHGRVSRIIPATASTFSLVPANNYASGNFTKVAQRIPVRIALDSLQGHTLYPNASAAVTIHIHT